MSAEGIEMRVGPDFDKGKLDDEVLEYVASIHHTLELLFNFYTNCVERNSTRSSRNRKPPSINFGTRSHKWELWLASTFQTSDLWRLTTWSWIRLIYRSIGKRVISVMLRRNDFYTFLYLVGLSTLSYSINSAFGLWRRISSLLTISCVVQVRSLVWILDRGSARAKKAPINVAKCRHPLQQLSWQIPTVAGILTPTSTITIITMSCR